MVSSLKTWIHIVVAPKLNTKSILKSEINIKTSLGAEMRPREASGDFAQLFATLGHATAHATRPDRNFGQTRFADPAYALEELVAELASAFIGATIGLPADHLEDHPRYIGGWLKALGDNPSAFLTAASKAQAAADWVLREMGVV